MHINTSIPRRRDAAVSFLFSRPSHLTIPSQERFCSRNPAHHDNSHNRRPLQHLHGRRADLDLDAPVQRHHSLRVLRHDVLRAASVRVRLVRWRLLLTRHLSERVHLWVRADEDNEGGADGCHLCSEVFLAQPLSTFTRDVRIEF